MPPFFTTRFRRSAATTFLTEGFSNDFAQWVLADANRDALAEQLAALDIRDYSTAALRADLCRVVRDFCEQHPEFANQTALEPFYFCESPSKSPFPLGLTACTLDEFRDGCYALSHSSFYFHFISSRLRLQLRTNDFSHWLADGLGLMTLAESVNRIDIYTNTLDSARAKLLRLVDRERRKHDGSADRFAHPAG